VGKISGAKQQIPNNIQTPDFKSGNISHLITGLGDLLGIWFLGFEI
jgi:hypothetical protein